MFLSLSSHVFLNHLWWDVWSVLGVPAGGPSFCGGAAPAFLVANPTFGGSGGLATQQFGTTFKYNVSGHGSHCTRGKCSGAVPNKSVFKILPILWRAKAKHKWVWNRSRRKRQSLPSAVTWLTSGLTYFVFGVAKCHRLNVSLQELGPGDYQSDRKGSTNQMAVGTYSVFGPGPSTSGTNTDPFHPTVPDNSFPFGQNKRTLEPSRCQFTVQST